jgi:serine protease Do
MRVAIDARSDLAVLVIGDGSTRFPHATLGDSDRVRVGDWVVAVGAPLGLQTTVTAGIVSSRARDSLGPEAPDYLLTSAALRFGNSGGPLVNMDGEVIGINTVFGFTSAGLAFTIPSNSARAVVPQLLATGRVRRAGLGLVTQRLTPDLAQALGTGTATGLLVADVIPGGPAAAAGLRPGDVLLSFEAQALRARTDLARALERAQPGRDVRLGVRERNGRERTVAVTLEQERDAMPTSLAVYRFPSLGFSVQTLTPDAGVVVNQVDERGAGGALRVGDLIREMNHVPVGGADEFARLADRLQPGRPVALLVQRGPLALYVAVTPRLPATARP